MNPYRHLLDDPVRLEGDEHTGECLSGMGIPWHQSPPYREPDYRAKVIDDLRQARKAKP